MGTGRVLVVDDEPDILDVLTDILEGQHGRRRRGSSRDRADDAARRRAAGPRYAAGVFDRVSLRWCAQEFAR